MRGRYHTKPVGIGDIGFEIFRGDEKEPVAVVYARYTEREELEKLAKLIEGDDTVAGMVPFSDGRDICRKCAGGGVVSGMFFRLQCPDCQGSGNA